MALWASYLVVSAAFSESLNGFASLEEMLAVRRALVGLSLSSSVLEETKSALEPEENEAHMAGG